MFLSIFVKHHFKCKNIKKVYKIGSSVVLSLIALPILLTVLLMIPSIQNNIAKRITFFLSEKYKTEISISQIQIHPFSQISLKQLLIRDQKTDTLLYCDEINVSIDIFALKNKEVLFNQISVTNPKINIYKENELFNFNFLIPDTTQKQSDWIITPANIQITNGIFKSIDWDDNSAILNTFIKKFNVVINNYYCKNDSLSLSLTHLSFHESSNLHITEGKARLAIGKKRLIAHNIKIKTEQSTINIDSISAKYNAISSLKTLNDSSHISIQISPSHIDYKDIDIFLKENKKIKYPIVLSGNFEGNLSNIKASDTKISFGNNSSIESEFNIIGLPNMNDAFVFLNIKSLQSNTTDISNLFKRVTQTGYSWSNDTFNKLGNIQFKGNVSGFFNDLVAYGDFNTNLGDIHTDLGIQINNRINFAGNIKTNRFNIGRMINYEQSIGNISTQISISGSHKSSKDFFAYMKGNIDSLTIKKYQYKNITINGLFANQKFDGQFELNDPNGKVLFSGNIDYSQTTPNFNFYATINNLKPDKLNIAPQLIDSEFSIDIISNFEANNITNLTGFIRADNGTIKNKDKTISIDSIIISAKRMGENKQLLLQSSLIDGEILGRYDFTNIKNSLNNFISTYIPELSAKKNNTTITSNNSFSFLFDIKEIGSLLNLFNPQISISKSGTISGQLNEKTSYFEIEGEIPSLQFEEINGENMIFSIKGDESISSLIQFDNLSTSNTLSFKNLSLQQTISNKDINTNIYWNNWGSKTNSGSIFTTSHISTHDSIQSIDIEMQKSHIILNDTVWNIKPTKISFSKNNFHVDNFRIWHSNQQITIDGFLARTGNDGLNGYIRNINMENTFNNLNLNIKNISGTLNAEFQIKDYFSTPSIIGDILIDDLYFNNERIGQFNTTSLWNDKKKSLIINTKVNDNGKKKLDGAGEYLTQEKSISYNAEVDSLQISFLNYYLPNIMQNLKGTSSGTVNLNGTLDKPILTGKLNVNNGQFDVNFLNTSFFIKDSVILTANEIYFKNMNMEDKNGNKGIFSGTIKHNSFSNLRFNLNIDVNNCLVLDTKPNNNPLYYGTVYSTGTMAITGTANGVNIDITASTMPKTSFYIPLQESSEASTNTFISFSNNTQYKHNTAINNKTYEIDLSGVEMTMDLTVTPDAQVQIIFDSRTGSALKGEGNGNVQLKIDKNENFLIFGDYQFDGGEYLFSLENLMNKRFIINKGSMVQWDGDPYDALLNVKATYKLKASLSDLTGSGYNFSNIGLSDEGNKRVPINCNVILSDRLTTPKIRFGIETPTLEPSAQTLIQSFIDSEEELNRQMLSLLFLNKFYTSDNQRQDANSSSNNAYLTTTAEVLSNHFSNMLSQINNNVDIGFSYRPGDELTKREIDLALSTQLFNDRVTISTNLGYEEYQATTNANNFIGDFEMNVKLNKSGTISAHGYHRTNNDIIATSTSPTKQGIGISFRKEFDSWSDLIKKYWAVITGSSKKEDKEEATSNKKE
ncbi:MAG: translocation/assembly module TamB domain-containing protein [Marinilabiliaceae bacterium]|nr:translocation/assembly module TamB domain-containing protein [Marinilabiliaceae bacterium]